LVVIGSCLYQGTALAVPSTSPLWLCHSERSNTIRNANRDAKSRNLLFACASPNLVRQPSRISSSTAKSTSRDFFLTPVHNSVEN
jgi:hypothetical protein